VLEVSTIVLIICTGGAHQEHTLVAYYQNPSIRANKEHGCAKTKHDCAHAKHGHSRRYVFSTLGCAGGKHSCANCEHDHSKNEPFLLGVC